MDNVYLIGIGGIGMSALARYYKHNNLFVAGYDRTPSNLTSHLQAEGIDINFQDSVDIIPKRIKDNPDSLIIFTPAIPKDSAQLQWFKDNDYKILKRSQALGYLAASKKCLAVAGTHGKTTTSTLLAHLLHDSGEGCTAFLGGISSNYNTNLILSKKNVLVAEADEFDRSFLQLWPEIAVVTSADADHLDIYNNHETILGAFADFAGQVKKSGTLIVKKGLESKITGKTLSKVLIYSYDQPCDFFASEIVPMDGGFFSFTFNYPGGKIEGCRVGIPGWINVENAIAASAIAVTHGLSPESIKKSLATFKGVRRRFDIRINTPECSYIDDYAHHPGELEAAISSMRNIFRNRKLTVVFQPHLYTRTRDFADGFAQSLGMADELILMDIYPARELPIDGVSSKMILDKVKLQEKTLANKDNLMEIIANKKIDVLVTFGAGDIDRFTDMIEKQLKEQYNV